MSFQDKLIAAAQAKVCPNSVNVVLRHPVGVQTSQLEQGAVMAGIAVMPELDDALYSRPITCATPGYASFSPQRP